MTNLLGVCSWSLTPDNEADLIDRVLACRLRRVQLALDPIREGQMDLRTLRERLADAGISVCSGMLTTVGEDYTTLGSIRRTGGVRPDEYWEENLSRARRCAAIAGELRVGLVTFHAGYIPEDDPALRGIMVERIAAVAAMFSEHGVRIGLETGQETAELLLDVLQTPDLQGVGVNFDPANMILYGMGDPCAAVETLSTICPMVASKSAAILYIMARFSASALASASLRSVSSRWRAAILSLKTSSAPAMSPISSSRRRYGTATVVSSAASCVITRVRVGIGLSRARKSSRAAPKDSPTATRPAIQKFPESSATMASTRSFSTPA